VKVTVAVLVHSSYGFCGRKAALNLTRTYDAGVDTDGCIAHSLSTCLLSFRCHMTSTTVSFPTVGFVCSRSKCCFMSTETVGILLIRDGNLGRPPRLSHNSWALKSSHGEKIYSQRCWFAVPIYLCDDLYQWKELSQMRDTSSTSSLAGE